MNQSNEPTVDGGQIALAYYNELQQIPGFEVMPLGVAKDKALAFAMLHGGPPSGGEGFQKLARFLDVDAVVIASVTEFSSYYPPRMGLAVRWYAANPCFHPIPAGYGLPWGTAEEEYIPDSVVFEAEFELAKQQLKTQSPRMPMQEMPSPQTPAESDTTPLVPKQAYAAMLARYLRMKNSKTPRIVGLFGCGPRSLLTQLGDFE